MGNANGIYNMTTGVNRTNVGFTSYAVNALTNISGLFVANQTAAANYAGFFRATATSVNFAVYGDAPSTPAAPPFFNVAIYGQSPTNAAATLPPTVFGTGTWAGCFNGDVLHTGWIGIPSDSSIKTNIKKFTKAASIINALNCYTYNYDSTKYGDHLNFPKSTTFGFLANEVAGVAQELVINGLLSPKVDTLGNVLINAQPVLIMITRG